MGGKVGPYYQNENDFWIIPFIIGKETILAEVETRTEAEKIFDMVNDLQQEVCDGN